MANRCLGEGWLGTVILEKHCIFAYSLTEFMYSLELPAASKTHGSEPQKAQQKNLAEMSLAIYHD